MTSLNSTLDEIAGTAEEEIETLKAIYIKELEVTYDDRLNIPIGVRLNLHPATADNADEQYVRLTLVIEIPLKYPNKLPVVVIRNPRGLSDEDLQRIYEDLGRKAQNCRGTPMLYELIELAKEHLTSGNTPRCSCAICLYGFCDEDAFIKTDCYHYFHSHCLRRYFDCSAEVGNDSDGEKCQVLCPVCRERIVYVRNDLEVPPPLLVHSESADNFVPDTDLLRLQRKMASLYVYQKSRGGIIDVEAEKNKFLLDISAVPNELNAGFKWKRSTGSAPSTGAANSSRPKSAESPKWSKNKLTNGRPKQKYNRGTDFRCEASREPRTVNTNKDACARLESANSVNGSEEFVPRENRRAPRRGSHHGCSRRGRGGSASGSGVYRENFSAHRASEQLPSKEDSRGYAASSSSSASFRSNANTSTRNSELNGHGPKQDRKPSAAVYDDARQKAQKRVTVTGPSSKCFGVTSASGPSDRRPTACRSRDDERPSSTNGPPRFKSGTAVLPLRTP